jgi:hypothetical protein
MSRRKRIAGLLVAGTVALSLLMGFAGEAGTGITGKSMHSEAKHDGIGTYVSNGIAFPLLTELVAKAEHICHVKVMHKGGGTVDELGISEWTFTCKILQVYKGSLSPTDNVHYHYRARYRRGCEEKPKGDLNREYIIFLRPASESPYSIGVETDETGRAKRTVPDYLLVDQWLGIIPFEEYLSNDLNHMLGKRNGTSEDKEDANGANGDIGLTLQVSDPRYPVGSELTLDAIISNRSNKSVIIWTARHKFQIEVVETDGEGTQQEYLMPMSFGMHDLGIWKDDIVEVAAGKKRVIQWRLGCNVPRTMQYRASYSNKRSRLKLDSSSETVENVWMGRLVSNPVSIEFYSD